ncbi:hypothetical protein AVEN_106113-1 [Araneus ventricosus]|uniref:Uncharacterized protein n=1 Tax=Araneus ventricosus TaxID=182803 RepID=A0A4Y2LXH2_ARAVE|nr:hypothetical protein AVEN_106113-1 [Araneus ventricosus]
MKSCRISKRLPSPGVDIQCAGARNLPVIMRAFQRGRTPWPARRIDLKLNVKMIVSSEIAILILKLEDNKKNLIFALHIVTVHWGLQNEILPFITEIPGGRPQVWAINCQQRKGPLFSRKIQSGSRNRLSPASAEWGGLRRDKAHRVNPDKDLFVAAIIHTVNIILD